MIGQICWFGSLCFDKIIIACASASCPQFGVDRDTAVDASVGLEMDLAALNCVIEPGFCQQAWTVILGK